MSCHPKYLDQVDKENSKVGVPLIKKDKNAVEEPQPRKTVLGESNSTITVVEPSSPEDTRLLNRKRQMHPLSCATFSIKLNY